MRHDKIATFYMKEQADLLNAEGLYTKSPAKPLFLMEKIDKDGLKEHFDVYNFKPFNKKDFYLAHTKDYVNNFFKGEGADAVTNNLTWSKNLVTSTRYTNASLYNAIRHSIDNPDTLCFSPTSGFHHAKPHRGSGFCTFSGQVIASTKLYRELGLVGAYLDLDEHFGNSIEDSREFVKDLDLSVPKYANINPRGTNEIYISNLRYNLSVLREKILNNEIHYLVWCHGADSHVYDALGGRVNTHYWLLASELFCDWVKSVEAELGRHIPITFSLFGGYRPDAYDSVLSLHIADLMIAVRKLLNKDVQYEPVIVVSERVKRNKDLMDIENGKSEFEY
jgi:acetoin utilization deacetylase AcuC-like enzyme